jgi:glycosyltransferase involved in cell wall biosynthesis
MSPLTRERRRLAIVTPAHQAQAGGSEYQIQCLLEVLEPLERYEVWYFASSIADQAHADSYRIVRIGRRRRPPRFGYLADAPALYRALEALAPSVIYQRVACGYTGIAAHYAQRHGAKLVWHVAHDSDVTPDGSLDGANPIRRLLEKRSVEYGIRRATCIVTQTEHQAQLLERHYGRRPDAVIANFHPAPRETLDKAERPLVVWVASLKQWKQPDAFLRLATALRVIPNARFLMAGPAVTGAWADSLHERIVASRRVEYLGALPQDEVNGLLARAHVFVNTSLYEGFPNTFIQAWLRETAVVSLHVDPDGLLASAGLGIFCGGSEQRLAEAVTRLLADPHLRASYTSRGRAHACERHSLANARALVNLFDAEPSASAAQCAVV